MYHGLALNLVFLLPQSLKYLHSKMNQHSQLTVLLSGPHCVLFHECYPLCLVVSLAGHLLSYIYSFYQWLT